MNKSQRSRILKKLWKNPTPAMIEGQRRRSAKAAKSWTPERRAAHSKRMSELWKNPTSSMKRGVRQRTVTFLERLTESKRQAISERVAKSWKNPTPAMIAGTRNRSQKSITPKIRRLRRSVMRKVAKKMWADPEFRKRRAEGLRAQWTEDRRKSQSEVMRRVVAKRWSDPLERKRQGVRGAKEIAKLIRSGRWPLRTSLPQLAIFDALILSGIKGFELEIACGPYRLDIANRRSKLCIEVDGEYWHAVNKTDYQKRDAFVSSKGWKILRVGTSKVGLLQAVRWAKRLSN